MVDEPIPELAQVFGTLAVELQNQRGVNNTLTAIVDGAVSLVPGATWAGISFIEGGRVKSRVPSDPLVAKLDGLQTDLNEGPCLTALHEHHTVSIEDMATETRWPQFSQAARDYGVGSLLSFQLFVERENLGALNLYGNAPHAFTEESLLTGGILAQHASVAIHGASARLQFDAALTSRDIIGQAKGIVMHRMNVNGLQAFQLLLKTSQRATLNSSTSRDGSSNNTNPRCRNSQKPGRGL